MTRIVVDPETLARLGQLQQPAELCDLDGRTIGLFTPAHHDQALYQGLVVPISEEELSRAEQETEEYSTADVLKHLEHL